MLEQLPNEIWLEVLGYLSQVEKSSLMMVSHQMYDKTVASLYQNLYLNERPTIQIPEYPFFGNNWSTLVFSKSSRASDKFKSLFDTLSKNTELCKLIHKIHCTWHLNRNLLTIFTKLICEHGVNVTYLENFLYLETFEVISKSSLAPQLESLDIVPHAKLPGPAYASYLTSITTMANRFDWSNIRSLTIYVDALMWFPNYITLTDKLRLTELCLNLRNDIFPNTVDSAMTSKFSDFFDVNTLEKLSILSWYETETFDVYEQYGLFDLSNFKNLREISLLSIFYNQEFLLHLFSDLARLERLKLDFMFDHVLSKNVVQALSEIKTLKYLDCKFDDLDEPILDVVELDEFAIFELNQMCLCDFCKHVYKDIILKKYFPTKQAFMIQNSSDIHSKHFINHIFKLYPIIPYFHLITTSPCIAYRSKSIEELAKKSNELLNDLFYEYESDTSDTKITPQDIISLYHCICHSMRRTFDFFLQLFPQLHILVINDIPTIIDEEAGQKYMKPIFYSKGYKNNQVYEVINDESLFS
ncbi:unnamed protein product [Kluyveromyces dobzhanskii CBS 2104]|uniref:WGS project CCBQ000000000 data, contig 00058 n=1 Tax=Kluyveromyces dobzhanskii CBS 2104 TaxID=1427455 RepID=A0A0A8LD92_9SACH|nr:unnamed protein product [Kluyveromyces dobzhanskii CBS 2104]